MKAFIILACFLASDIVSSTILPTYVYEKGDTGRIPCIVRGESQAHFWKVGEMFNISKPVASYIHGSPDLFANETYGKFTVLGDGTLLIYHIDYADTGNYHCRVVTKSSEYYGSAAVYIKALGSESSFGITECNETVKCRLFPEMHSELTCTATFVTSQLNLRWVNYSVELPSLIVKEANEDGSFNVTSKIRIDYRGRSILACEAFGEAMESIYELVELEEEQPDIAIPASPWKPISIVLILLFVVCAIVLVVILLKTKTGKQPQNLGTSSYEKVPMPEEEKERLEEELKRSKDDNDRMKADLKSSTEDNEKIKSDLKRSKDDNDRMKADLKGSIEDNEKIKSHLKNILEELAQRKSRSQSHRDDSQTFLRIRSDGREETENSKKRREGVFETMKNEYKLTKIFQPEEKASVVFESLEGIVQSTVDGNKTCIVVFGGPKSGKSFTMSNYDPTSPENNGIIPRVMSKLLESKRRFLEKGIGMNVMATHIVTYKEDGNESFKFFEMNDSKAEERMKLAVKGLKVEMPFYRITEEKQAINLLKDQSKNDEKSNIVKTMDSFHLYVETTIHGNLVSKGSLSLATFCDFNAVKRFINNDKASPVISLMSPLIADKSCQMAIVGTMNMDVSEESQQTLEFIEKVKDASQARKKK